MLSETGTPRPRRGQVSAQPRGFYQPVAVNYETGSVIEFFGEDNRRITFSFAELPCPELHDGLAAAWARRIGPTGGLRTRGSVENTWTVVTRFVRWLGELERPPRTLRGLSLSHLRRYDRHRRMTANHGSVLMEMSQLRMLLLQVQPSNLLREDVLEYLERPGQLYGRWQAVKTTPPPGYSDREFAAIMAAARSDVVALRQRLRTNRELVDQLRTAPDTLTEEQHTRADALARMLDTGRVPSQHDLGADSALFTGRRSQKQRAALVFLTAADIVPLLVLGVGLSGRNGETIKELGDEHRVLENRALAVNVLKRRRGKSRDRETIHWEVGRDSAQLHTPGGWFLLLHELTAPSRIFSRTSRIWAIWTGDIGPGPEYFVQARKHANGHIDPFELRLGRVMKMHEWVAQHGLTTDPASEDSVPEPLVLSMSRLKKTVEVRTTRELGGHLPSASRTNTPDVSFLHYLRNDPRIKDWAEQILTEALEDTEASAHAFQGRILDRRAVAALGANPEATAAALGTTTGILAEAATGNLDTLVASCLDYEHSPHSGGGVCAANFLTCLRCPNALVAERHLPKMFALLGWLQTELDASSVEEWCGRHGTTWLIITRLILPKFTAAQQEQGRDAAPATLPIELLDNLKEPS